jgi:hypothetical protein
MNASAHINDAGFETFIVANQGALGFATIAGANGTAAIIRLTENDNGCKISLRGMRTGD